MSNVVRVYSSTKLTVSSSYSKTILWRLVLRGSCVSTKISNLRWLSVKSLVPYLEQRHRMGHLISLLAHFPISGCAYLSSQLEWRRWQKQYHSCQGDGYVHRHHTWKSTSIRAWGVHLACGHLGPHGGCRTSCCWSKSKTKNKSAKEILNENDSFFFEYERYEIKDDTLLDSITMGQRSRFLNRNHPWLSELLIQSVL